MTTAPANSPIKQPPFELQAVEVMRGLRAALLNVIDALPEPIHRAADLERSLSLSTTLAWQIHRIATVTNPLSAGSDVPGPAAFRQVLNAAQSKGVTKSSIENVLSALTAFENLVKRHAGDRETFSTMINSLAGDDAGAIDLKMRRQAFRLHSRIWGVQVRAIHNVGLYHPGRNSSVFDVASVRGLTAIRRLRVAAPLRLTSQLLTDGKHQTTNSQPLDVNGADNDSSGPNLLLEYCTRPYPKLDNRIDNGAVHTYLHETPLGNVGAQTVYVGDITRDIEWATPGDADNDHLDYYGVMKPAEVLVKDVLIHRDMFGPLTPEVTVNGSLDRLGEHDPLKFQSDELLPMQAEVHHLGTGTSVLPTAHIPRYAEMIRAVTKSLDWDAEAFDVYRCIIEYPLLSSVVTVHFKLPERGNW